MSDDARSAPSATTANPTSIEGGYLRTHPSTAERFVAIDNGELVGLWQIKRQRLLKTDDPLDTGAPLAYGFDCADLAAVSP